MTIETPTMSLYERMCLGRACWRELPWDTRPPESGELLPNAVSAATFARTWPELVEEERQRLGHLQLAVETESFIYLEHAIIVSVNAIVARLPPDAPEAPALAKLAEEEYNHIHQFKRYLLERLPDLYPTFYYRFKPKALVRRLNRILEHLAHRSPAAIFFWAEFFELMTIQLHHILRSCEPAGDPLLHAMHALHAREEARHVLLEKLLIERFFESSASARKVLDSWATLVVFSLVRELERRGYGALHARFVREFPRTARFHGLLSKDLALESRTALVDQTVAGFATDYRRLRPIVGRAIFERVILRGVSLEVR